MPAGGVCVVLGPAAGTDAAWAGGATASLLADGPADQGEEEQPAAKTRVAAAKPIVRGDPPIAAYTC